MAIASMQKVMVVAHRSQATKLLETLQDAGLVQILDAERAMVSKEWPELVVESRRHRGLEDSLDRFDKAIGFLKPYIGKESTSLFMPRIAVDSDRYKSVVSTQETFELLSKVEAVSSEIEQLTSEADGLAGQIERLTPWQPLKTPLEQLHTLSSSTVFVGLIPDQHVAEAMQRLAEQDVPVEKVNHLNRTEAVIIVCLNKQAGDIHKELRAFDFEATVFEGLKGTAEENLFRIKDRVKEIDQQIQQLQQRAAELASERITLQIMYDHLQNLHDRIHTESHVPATEHTVFFEGWVKKQDYAKLELLVTDFDACDVALIDPAEDEEVPVEIENGPMSQPFESVTRLYGMPASSDVDPTAFLAPFFALFFGICLTDAAYGLVMIAFCWWLLRKIKGDKKFVMMLVFCSVMTVIAGALTGGWCGDAIQKFFPQLNGVRNALMWFDPLEKPMYFFNISLGLGYLQIICGVFIGFWHKFRSGDKTAAIFDHLSWFIWLNSLAIFGLGKGGILPSWLGTIGGIMAIVPGVMIVLFSEREGNWGARIGMGIYNVFSTVFYVGDVLSYIRLMALGMVTAGFGMAINEIVKTVMSGGILGWILGLLIFVGGHVFNIANSALGSFVHSMRLQFVEFFTKFLQGGGKEFDPLKKSWRYINVKK